MVGEIVSVSLKLIAKVVVQSMQDTLAARRLLAALNLSADAAQPVPVAASPTA
jgi:hypothetical protein